MYDEYVWLVVCGAFMCFTMAWGIGANDVANSFGTSVGAKTISLKQACLIAAVFEFAGALTLGRVVTGTISGGIASIDAFKKDADVFMYGMLSALTAATVWLFYATYMEWPVSTTHSIIGGVIGFSLAFKGGEAVIWNEETLEFPFRKGITVIVISWFTSPVFAAVGAAVIFFLCRTLVLRRENSFQKSFYILPAAILLTIFINVFFVLSKGAGKLLLETAKEPGGDQSWCSNDGCSDIKDAAGMVTKKNGINTDKAGWVAVAAAAGCAVLGSAILIPLLKRQALRKFENSEKETVDVKAADAEDGAAGAETFMGKMKRLALSGVNQDIHDVIQTDDAVFALHEAVEQFDPKTEISFQYLQVFSAICVSFAHGANDVANAAGPLSAIFAVYEVSTTYRKKMVKEAEVPVWVLIIGAVGLVVGLGTYGYNIMRARGVRMAAMTPSRGYAAELSTSLVISIASAYGMPISTTHTITGAVVGVGLMEGRKGVNWKHLGKTFTSWVFTLIVVGFLSAALFSQGAYAPSVQGNREVQSLAKTMSGITSSSDPKVVPGLVACIKIFGEATDSKTLLKNGKCNI
jgi:sodium-dependent phosphate transporter